MARAFIVAIAFAALIAGEALAQEAGGRAPVPDIPKAQGGRCVRDPAFMRRYHMTMLLEQRDETVHQGIRGGDFSLARCVACHAVAGADGQPVGYSDPKHFCRSCHAYASVSIDCFECHASKPETTPKAAEAAPVPDADLATLDAFVSEVEK
jgi:predicted CXXCH cytochrome family protein